MMTTIHQAGANLLGIQAAAPPESLFSDAASLQALAANAGALSTAVTAGGLVIARSPEPAAKGVLQARRG